MNQPPVPGSLRLVAEKLAQYAKQLPPVHYSHEFTGPALTALQIGNSALAAILEMHRDETLSEGQCCQFLALDRVAFRKLRDEVP